MRHKGNMVNTKTDNNNKKSLRLPVLTLIAFAGPAFATKIMHGPGGGILAGIYAKYFGLSLAGLGTVLLVARIFDAVTDPLIGFASDRTVTKLGRRKPWMIVGFGLSLVAMYFLFIPEDDVSLTYFLIAYLSLFLFWTMAEIPYQAWQAELSGDYNERTRIVTYRAVSEQLGYITFALLPLLPFFATSQITPEVLKTVVIVVAIFLPITVILAVVKVPTGKYIQSTQSHSMWNFVCSLKHNKPALYLMVAFMCYGIAEGIFATTMFLFTDSYLQEGEKFPYLLLGISIGGMVMFPFWLKVINKYGKHQTWAFGCTMVACLAPMMMFAKPGPMGFPIFVTVVTLMLLFLSANIGEMAILSDVVDYDTVQNGECRSGQFFALRLLIFKFNYAIGGAIAFFSLNHFGFDATNTIHSSTASFGIRFTMGGLTAIFVGLAVIPLLFFPLNKKKHAEIRRQLEELDQQKN